MADPSIGSSSPNWATLVSNDFSRNYTKTAATAAPPPSAPASAPASPLSHVYCTPTLQPNMVHGPPPTGLPQSMAQDSPLSPYASVFYPMGSYASHLLSLEQAAQINPQSYPPPPPRVMEGMSVDEFFPRNAGMEPAWSIRVTPNQRNLQQHQQAQRQPTELQQLPPIGTCLSQAAVSPMAPMPCVADDVLPAWSTLEPQQQQQQLAESTTAQAHVQVPAQPLMPHQPAIREDWRGYEQLVAAVAPQPQSQTNLGQQQQQQLAHPPPPVTPPPLKPTLDPASAPVEPSSIPSQPVPHSISVVYDYWREIEEMISAFIAEASADQTTDQSNLWRHINLPHPAPTANVDSTPAEFDELWSDQEVKNTQRHDCSKPAEPKAEQKPQTEQQHQPESPTPPPATPSMLPTTHREREWWLDAEQKVATAVVAPQPQVNPLADPVCDWWVTIENKTANVLLAKEKEKEKEQLQQQKQQQQKQPPSSPETEQQQQSAATSAPREWWQAAAFTPQQQSVQPVQTVQPLQQIQGSRRRNEPAGEWRPYSYAAMSPALPKSMEEKHHEPSRGEGSAAGCSRSPTIATGATTSSPVTSAPSVPSAPPEFPSFEDFARQVTECSLSSSEYIATLRNLMIRAHNLMLPLLRGRFANMTQVQMAAYTTAILEITPLHPSLFLPSHLSPSWISSAGLLPPCHPHSLTPQDLARIQPRPLFANASTQTEYHCWCMHMTMFPPPILHGPPASRNQNNPSVHFSSPPNGPRMMAPCGTSFWGRPMVPIHAYPHAHQLSRPHGSRYGYRINTYMPYRSAFASSSNNRPRHPSPIYSSAMHMTKEQTKPLATGGSLNDSSNVRLGSLEEQQTHPVDSTSVLQLANVCSLQSVASLGHSYSISLHSSSRSSSVGGSDAEDFEDNRDEAVTGEKEAWQKCCQKSQHAISVEDLQQDEDTDSSAEQQTSTKRVIIKQVNSIFLQPTGSMMSNMPIMPMMQFMRQGGGSPDMPCPVYNINESYNPNFDNTLPGCMSANAMSDSTDPKNMADNGDSETLASHRQDDEVFAPLDVNGNRRSEGCNRADEPDRCLRSEIRSNTSQTSTVPSLGVAHKILTDRNDEAAMSLKGGDNCQDRKVDGELVNQSISPVTHNADTTN